MLSPDYNGTGTLFDFKGETVDDLMEDTILYSRPSRFWDGEGMVDRFDRTTNTQANVGLRIHDDAMTMIFDADEDIRAGDIIQVPHQ